MPGFLLHVNAVMTCIHVAGQAKIAPTQPRVLVSGQAVATIPPGLPTIAVIGCPFTIPGPKPQPCVTVRWSMPTARVMVMGLPAKVKRPLTDAEVANIDEYARRYYQYKETYLEMNTKPR